jgi:hypothetical protein
LQLPVAPLPVLEFRRSRKHQSFQCNDRNKFIRFRTKCSDRVEREIFVSKQTMSMPCPPRLSGVLIDHLQQLLVHGLPLVR